jgi:hypothetical protein
LLAQAKEARKRQYKPATKTFGGVWFGGVVDFFLWNPYEKYIFFASVRRGLCFKRVYH